MMGEFLWAWLLMAVGLVAGVIVSAGVEVWL